MCIRDSTCSDLSVVTSGIYERCFLDKATGAIHHHILDPKTGRPCESDLASATVLSRTSIEGDGLSTALLIMGLSLIHICYQLTRIDAQSASVVDSLVLPSSMKPPAAGSGDTGFMFSFEAIYNFGEGIANLGTYIPANTVQPDTDGEGNACLLYTSRPRECSRTRRYDRKRRPEDGRPDRRGRELCLAHRVRCRSRS